MVLDVAKNPKRKLTHRYASSIGRQLPVSPCALMMGILYSERLRQLNPNYMERVSSSDIFVVSMMVASKFLVDEGEDDEVLNDEWAEASGLAVSTVNKLEREFLHALDWNLFVKPTEFLEFCNRIETKIAYKYGLQRGWFSYTDLAQFLIAREYQKILHGIMESTVRIIGGCALLYGMSLSIIATSIMCYASPLPSRPVVSTRSIGECSNEGLGTTMSYTQRCFTRARDMQTKRNTTNSVLNEDESSLDDQLIGIPDEIMTSLIKENLTTSRVHEPFCDCDPVRNCFDAGVNFFRPNSVSAVEIVFSARKSLCKWLPLSEGTSCNCDPGGGKGGSIKNAPMLNPAEEILRYSRKQFYANALMENPKLFGMVIM